MAHPTLALQAAPPSLASLPLIDGHWLNWGLSCMGRRASGCAEKRAEPELTMVCGNDIGAASGICAEGNFDVIGRLAHGQMSEI